MHGVSRPNLRLLTLQLAMRSEHKPQCIITLSVCCKWIVKTAVVCVQVLNADDASSASDDSDFGDKVCLALKPCMWNVGAINSTTYACQPV